MVQGDAHALPDGWVPFGQVLGRATALERGGRRCRLDSPGLTAAGRMWALLVPLRWRLMKAFHLF
jgi:hypothetical protein